MTLYDEEKAVCEIRGLPLPARSHLRHVYRNGLQTILCCIETGLLDEARRQVRKIANELQDLGL